MKNLCPVIEIEDLQRAYLYLPSKEKVNAETKSDTHIVLLEGDEDKAVIFDWDDMAEGWRLRNKVVLWPNDGDIIDDCEKCGKGIDHIVNKIVTKKKCKKCGLITELKFS
ncbi:MAG: hypothetical protein ACK53T_02275 [Planctomycetota bacterium]